jgi:hypothetical protein
VNPAWNLWIAASFLEFICPPSGAHEGLAARTLLLMASVPLWLESSDLDTERLIERDCIGTERNFKGDRHSSESEHSQMMSLGTLVFFIQNGKGPVGLPGLFVGGS